MKVLDYRRSHVTGHAICAIMDSELTSGRLFDNAATGWVQEEPRARSMILVLDMENMSVSLERDYPPYVEEASVSQGSTRVQPNGDVLAGYVQTEQDPICSTCWAKS